MSGTVGLQNKIEILHEILWVINLNSIVNYHKYVPHLAKILNLKCKVKYHPEKVSIAVPHYRQ